MVDKFGINGSVWMANHGGQPHRLVAEPEALATKEQQPSNDMMIDVPAWSPDGSHLAVVATDRAQPTSSRILTFDRSGHVVRRSDAVAARIEVLLWDGSHSILALGAEAGADSVVTSGAVRYTAPARRQRPRVSTPGRGKRRLYEASASGRVRTLGPSTGSIWDVCLAGREGPVVVWSADPSESGWYHASLSRLDRETGEVTPVYQPEWQLSPIIGSPAHSRVAVIEGWSSDRSRVCGDVRLVDVVSGEVSRMPHIGVDIVRVAWRSADTLWFAGWSGFDAVWGWLAMDGTVGMRRTSAVKPAEIAFPAGTQGTVWAVSDPPDAAAPEVVLTQVMAEATDSGEGFVSRTRLSRGQISSFAEADVRSLTWKAADGLEIHGLLVRSAPSAAPASLVVYAHGGPANLWNRSLSPEVRFLVDAGHAVLLANPRGSVGRGQAFATVNLGDPGGRELTDLLAGMLACGQFDDVDTRRAAIVGGSYGGYLAACGAAMSDAFRCAVVMFGHPDLLSARYGSNNPAFLRPTAARRPHQR